MDHFLPPNLLALFAARDPLPFLPPLQKLPHEKDSRPYSGIAEFVQYFEDSKEAPPPIRVETKEEQKERKKKERAEQAAYKLEKDLALWDPLKKEVAAGDPLKTIFVGRISYDTSESKLRREFEDYGSIKSIVMVKDEYKGIPRGYAFIEFKRTSGFEAAYRKADGKKIDGRRILVDVERGRTVKGWRPRRLGGGLGGTRKGAQEDNTLSTGRDDFDGRNRDHSRLRSRSRDRKRSRSRDTERRKRSRERKPSSLRDVKKEPGESARKVKRNRSRGRTRSGSRDRKRSRVSRSRSRGKKVKTEVKKETGDGGYGNFGGYGGAPQPPNTFIKQEQDGYYQNQPQESEAFGQNVPLPPLPTNPYQQ